MNEQKRIVKVRAIYLDDWMGLYINGKLEHDNHSIDDTHLLSLIAEETIEPASIDFKHFWADGVLDEFDNHCPDNWNDLSIYEGWVE
jgi:hypothetical protein